MAPIAAKHPCHRPADRKSTSRLGKCEALLGEHAVRFEIARTPPRASFIIRKAITSCVSWPRRAVASANFIHAVNTAGFRLAACSYDNAEQEADAQCDC